MLTGIGIRSARPLIPGRISGYSAVGSAPALGALFHLSTMGAGEARKCLKQRRLPEFPRLLNWAKNRFDHRIDHRQHNLKNQYPGVAQLVGRHIWDVEAGRSSRPTRTKSPLKSAISEDFFFVYCAPSTAVPKLSERLRLCLYFRRSLSCVYSGLQIFFP